MKFGKRQFKFPKLSKKSRKINLTLSCVILHLNKLWHIICMADDMVWFDLLENCLVRTIPPTNRKLTPHIYYVTVY